MGLELTILDVYIIHVYIVHVWYMYMYIHLVQFVLFSLGNVSGCLLCGSACEGDVVLHCLVGLRDEPEACRHSLHLVTQLHS